MGLLVCYPLGSIVALYFLPYSICTYTYKTVILEHNENRAQRGRGAEGSRGEVEEVEGGEEGGDGAETRGT